MDDPANKSWWEAADFASACRAYNTEQRRLGDSELPPAVRDYLDTIATCQHQEASALPRRPVQRPPSSE